MYEVFCHLVFYNVEFLVMKSNTHIPSTRVVDESTASGTSGSAVTSSSGSKSAAAGVVPLPAGRNNGIPSELAIPPASNPAADSADGERLKPMQLMPPPIRLPIDKAALINGVGKLDLRRVEEEKQQQQQQQPSEDGLVMMTILPDEKGRFGFNVKGGADQKMPIIVSRVGVNTPADKYAFQRDIVRAHTIT